MTIFDQFRRENSNMSIFLPVFWHKNKKLTIFQAFREFAVFEQKKRFWHTVMSCMYLVLTTTLKLRDFKGWRKPSFSTKAFKKVVFCKIHPFFKESHLSLLLSFYQILRKRNLYDTFYPTCIKVRQLWAAQATHSAAAAQAFRHVFGYCFFQKISKRKMLVAVLAQLCLG